MTKTNIQYGMIPVMTTVAGSCLTSENWQEAGVKVAAYDLAALLLKPGYDFLTTLPSLADYVGWHEPILLNASLVPGKDGVYSLRSPYSGCYVHHTLDEILQLIRQLQPQFVVLPKGVQDKGDLLWQFLQETQISFFLENELPLHAEGRKYGVYFPYFPKQSITDFLSHTESYQSIPRCVVGDLDFSLMQQLLNQGVHYLTTNTPAEDAYHGRVYCEGSVISLQDNDHVMEFCLLENNCQCPTCRQQFSRAYLHHLLAETPLLCQRLLIQHNVYYCQNKFRHSSFTSA